VSRHDVPVPSLLRYALKLIGLQPRGPGEKVAWCVDFTYQLELRGWTVEIAEVTSR
jgi:hypothetical protein